jgi:hypothetical protein
MRQFMAWVMVGCMAMVPALAAETDQAAKEKAKQLLKDVDFCYAVSALAASTVQLRNQGQTQEEQLARRKASLDEGQYALIADITAQVYAKDLRDLFVVAGDTNASCLDAKDHGKSFVLSGQKACPKVGLMRAEVDAMRRRGTSAKETVAALKERYAGVHTALHESLKDIAGEEPKGDVPDTGAFDNQMCMILAMTGE